MGAALSGGLDSSCIVCAMRYLNNDLPIHTFTYVDQDAEINEFYWADIVNKHVKAIPHIVKASSDNLMQDFND